jgi:hypothetical protein
MLQSDEGEPRGIVNDEQEAGGTSGELIPYPEATIRDYGRAGLDAGLAAIPVVGGSLQVLVDTVLAPSLSKRRDRWIQELADLVEVIRKRVDTDSLEFLAGDEAFVTAVADASRIAMGTHLEEKLRLLKNCLLHMATQASRPDDFMSIRFLRFVEDLTPEHFVVLQYMANPRAWFDAKGITRPNLAMGSPGQIMNQANLPVVGTVRELVIRDLADRTLANVSGLNMTMTVDGAWQPMATPLGQQLLSFVSESDPQ